MAEENQNSNQNPGTGADPAAGVAPAAGAAPPAANAGAPAAGGAPAAVKRNGAPEFIKIPTKEFKKRISREAAQILQKELGISLEEAKRRLAGGAAPAAGTPSAGAAPPAAAGTPPAASAEDARLREELRLANEKAAEETRRRKKIARRGADQIQQTELKLSAFQAGVKEDEIDYVLHRYGQHIRALPENQAVPQPKEFFVGLRTKHPHLFAGAPAPVTLVPTTAPPESRQPGGETPNPKTPGKTPPEKSVDDMDDREFSRHTARTYGYTPGAA